MSWTVWIWQPYSGWSHKGKKCGFNKAAVCGEERCVTPLITAAELNLPRLPLKNKHSALRFTGSMVSRLNVSWSSYGKQELKERNHYLLLFSHHKLPLARLWLLQKTPFSHFHILAGICPRDVALTCSSDYSAKPVSCPRLHTDFPSSSSLSRPGALKGLYCLLRNRTETLPTHANCYWGYRPLQILCPVTIKVNCTYP